ncbi:MAG: hypothetical protein CVU98_07180 [Firmicutes bacterium HGW-Firmicutes-3]|nr:MAG: hypothetical protein CVU98_07180 [Firmicutes bacterium HGW-Firmicutes-3]
MMIKGLLPIGSVVKLKEGIKRVMIFGVKQTNEEDNTEYDYIGVLYPEGNIGLEYQYLFNHSDVETIYYRGYEDEERISFIEELDKVYNN